MAELEVDWKKEKLNNIRAYHANLIADLGISVSDFNMKKPFYDKKGREVVGIFASEFSRSKGFFFELIDSNLDPSDPQRKVYRVTPNPNYEEEYELNAKNSYNVPMEELRIVNASSVAISKMSAVTTTENFKKQTQQQTAPLVQMYEDAPYAEMTIRDYIAIHTGKPVSNKTWLNELIKS